jgi:TRAP-type C4-dicarboxylate transport system permease small subunit
MNDFEESELSDSTEGGWRPLNMLVAIFIGAMMVLGATDVTLRYVFDAPLSWGIPVIGMLLGLTIFSGLINVCREDEHITVGLLDRFVTGRVRKFQIITVYIVGVCSLGFITFRLSTLSLQHYDNQNFHEMIDVYNWPFSLIFAVLALVSTLFTARNLIRVLRSKPEDVHLPDNPDV